MRMLAHLFAAACLVTGLAAFAQEEPAPSDEPAAEDEAPAPAAEPAPSEPPPAESQAAPATVETIPVAIDEPQEEPGDDRTQLDTIQVTSSKRVKSQRDIPGSVGAIRGADLEAMRAQGLRDYVKLVPGVIYADQGNEESVPVIRGISTSLGFGATPVTVGIYMDDMPFADLFSPSSIPDLNPFDLERVEILKGPQGTLFGSGALAGAIRYIVQKPEHGVWQGKAMGTFSQNALSEDLSPVYAAGLNVPVFGDKVALRGVFVKRDEAGVYDMSAHDANGATLRDDKDADGSEQQSARVLGSWRITDDLSLSAFYFDQTTHQDDFGLADQAEDPGSDQFPFPSPRDHDFGGGNVTAVYDFPWARMFGSYNKMTKHNYVAQHQEFGLDLEQQQDNEYVAVFGDDIDGFTQEIRISSPEGGDSNWEWLVGGSYLEYGNESFQYSYIGPDMPDPTATDQVSDQEKAAAQVFATTDQIAYETALFGEVTGKLGDHWELTVGARQYETKLEAKTALCGAQVVALFQQLCYPQQFTDVAKGLNPKFSVRYLHDRHIQAYVLAAKGFQFGGVQVNPPAPGFPESAEQAGYSFGPYKSSELWNYELGVRTEWLDRRLRVDATFFYQDWKDLQMTVSVPLFPTNLNFAVIGNVGRAHSEGAELALEVLPFAGAKFVSAVSLVNAVTDVLFDANSGDGGVRPGTQLPGAPRFQWSNQVAYEHAVPYFTSWVIGPTVTYAYGSVATDQIRPTGTIGEFGTLDARLSLSQPSSRFQPEISLGMNNVTDVRGATYHVGGNTATDGAPYEFKHYNPPRTTVLSVSLRY
jgi:iron complex outermembrane recepter protein